jgi:hypothetical protein
VSTRIPGRNMVFDGKTLVNSCVESATVQRSLSKATLVIPNNSVESRLLFRGASSRTHALD